MRLVSSCPHLLRLYQYSHVAYQLADDIALESAQIQGYYMRTKMAAQWLIYASKPASQQEEEDESVQEMRELFEQLDRAGFKTASNLEVFQATLDSEMVVLRKQLSDMKNDPSCKDMFS